MLDAANDQEVILYAKGSIWKVAKDAIQAMAPDLENMNFEIFSKFTILKKQLKSREQQQCKRRKLSRLNQNEDKEQGYVQQDEFNLTFMSKSTFDGYQNALVHFYRISNIVMLDVIGKKFYNSWVGLTE